MKIATFEQCLWVVALDLFTLHFKDKNGDLISMEMPMAVAGELVGHAQAALTQAANEGRPVQIVEPPERVLRYNAKRAKGADEVLMTLVLDRTNARRLRLTLTDAKRLGALLTSEAESSGDPNIKH